MLSLLQCFSFPSVCGTVVLPSSCSVKHKAQALSCSGAGLPQRFCLSVCGLSLAGTKQSPGSSRGISLWCLPRTLLLSLVCRLGCSDHAFGGPCIKGLVRAGVSCEVRGTVFLLGQNFNKTLVSSQHNQWVCFASEGRTQDVPHQSLATAAQSEVSQCVPSTGEKCFKFPG